MSKVLYIAATATALSLAAAPSHAVTAPTNTLEAIGDVTLDADSSDHDLFTAGVKHVLTTKKRTRLKWLADGDKAATVFIPTDNAVTEFITEMTGIKPASEEEALKVFLDTWNVYEIEWIIRYHVVKGKELNTFKLVTQQAQDWPTLGRRYTVKAQALTGPCNIKLIDGDTNRPDAHTVKTDVYKAGKQTSHIIDRVMFPRTFDKPEVKSK